MKRTILRHAASLRKIPERPLIILEQIVSRRNALFLLRLFASFIVLLTLYSIVFHFLMEKEGKDYHWFVGVYWTLATMTTVGYGDIVFTTIPGLVYSVVVMVSGIFFLLVIVPFTLIQLFQSAARLPREVPLGTKGHIILTHVGPITSVLIDKLSYYSLPYVLITPDFTEAVQLRDKRIRAVLGELDDPLTYKKAGIDSAALLATTHNDVQNTTIIHAVRQISESAQILATATETESFQILNAAGANEVLALDEMMGLSLARRTIAGDAIAHTIGQLGSLVIAEAAAFATPLVNKTLKETQLRELTGVAIVGILEGPNFFLPHGDMIIHKNSILVLAGDPDSIARYNELFCIYNSSDNPVIIIGAGNVGTCVARSFDEHGLEYRIIEKNPQKATNAQHVFIDHAAHLPTLEKVGFFHAPAVVIATHDDDTNIYLATLFRNLRSDIQIVSRATLDRNVGLLHRAGCDIVLSYASFGSNFIINHLKKGTYLMLSEGVDVFRIRTPKSFAGRTINDLRLRETIGCHVVATSSGESMELISSGDFMFTKDTEIVLIAGNEAEAYFLKLYGREI